MSRKILSKSGVTGVYREVVRNVITGEVVDTFEERNVITDTTYFSLTRLISENTTALDCVKTLSIGTDVGSGTTVTPEQPESSITMADHAAMYVVPEVDFLHRFPTNNSVEFYGTIVGTDVMALFPTESSVVYNSAVLVTDAGNAFSYKRFSGRTISELLSVEVSWTITFNEVAGG